MHHSTRSHQYQPASHPAGCAVLTYHSQNISGSSSANNDHVALAADLEALHIQGYRFISLDKLVDWLDGRAADEDMRSTVCLTFDDGCDFDVRDLDYPGVGPQQSFLSILENFASRHGPDAQPGLHATSFVIASPEARELIDSKSLFGTGLISEDWWREANAHPLMSIGNHGWDHNHPDLEISRRGLGGFTSVDDAQQCEQQVIAAAGYIEKITSAWPAMFAYPFGESSRYIRQEFFAVQTDKHGCRAAFGTDPGVVVSDTDRWNLPRFVCGRDWNEPTALVQLLQSA